MELFQEFTHWLIYAIEIVSVLVLVVGFLLCVKDMIIIAVNPEARRKKEELFKQSRIDLGGFILMGLEILIIADIIETLIQPSINDFVKLVVIVLIRTTLSFFLNKEVEHLEHANQKPCD